jgi:hypothetical protein
MASLSGQTIQSTYQGLLKLEDSTSGITEITQQIQDGLGNNTGLKIKQGFFSAPNIFSPKFYEGDYFGTGFGTNAGTPVTLNANQLVVYPFYDSGLFSYSALTYNLTTASTVVGEQLHVAFYDSQFISGVGLCPNNLIYSAITLPVSAPTGLKTVSLSPNLSFSATGQDIYFFAFSAVTTASTFSFRIATPTAPILGQFTPYICGFVISNVGTSAQNFLKSNGNVIGINYSGITSFPTSFNSTQANSTAVNINPITFGFLLHTIK